MCSIISPNCVIAKELKILPTAAISMRNIYIVEGNAHLGLAKGRAIKRLVVCNSWEIESLDGLILGCYQPYNFYCKNGQNLMIE